MTVTATLSAAMTSSAAIALTLSAGTAETGDYGSLTSIRIARRRTIGTTDADADDETFTVALGTLPSGVVPGDPSAVATMIRDSGDTPPSAIGTSPPLGIEYGAEAAIDVEPFFAAPDDDPLIYRTVSMDDGVVVAAVAGSLLTLTAVGVRDGRRHGDGRRSERPRGFPDHRRDRMRRNRPHGGGRDTVRAGAQPDCRSPHDAAPAHVGRPGRQRPPEPAGPADPARQGSSLRPAARDGDRLAVGELEEVSGMTSWSYPFTFVMHNFAAAAAREEDADEH